MRPAEIASAQTLIEPLTRRESQMLALLAEGFTRPEMAIKLTIGLTSVKFHIHNLYGKLGVNSKRQALSRAQELGLLAAPDRPGLAAVAPGPAARHNLPMAVTRFFGREAEMAQLRDRLDDNRLVTLTGSGGVGKTRLAVRVAEDALDDFGDGVWFVELAALVDAESVPRQAAASLGLRDEPGRTSLDTLTRYLRQRQALLVLDNCEHLLKACARLAGALLRACPVLKILSTSRAPLGIDGEALFRVPSLAFPAAGQALPARRLGEFPSVRLFIDRARLVLPDYRVAAHNAAAIASICQRLDGIPLALELAAARVKLLTAEQVASRLDDSLRLLTSGSHTALPRHQTLAATIAWSFDLLAPPERRLLLRLSVFAGSCTLAAAEAVCADEGLTADQVLDRLTALVDKSLVIAERRANQDTRYHLLEMVRQFASVKLVAAGDSPAVRTRHRDYFLAYVEGNQHKLDTADENTWASRLAPDLDNVRAALDWSFSETGAACAPGAGPRLTNAVLWLMPSFVERSRVCERAMAYCQGRTDISDRVYVDLLSSAAAVMAYNDPHTGAMWMTQAVEISRRLGPDGRETLINNLRLLGDRYSSRGDFERALGSYAEAEALAFELWPEAADPVRYRQERAGWMGKRATIAYGQGDYVSAKRLAADSLSFMDAAEGSQWVWFTRITLADASVGLGELDAARAIYQESLRIADHATGDDQANYRGHMHRCLGMVDLLEGKLEAALEHAQQCLRYIIPIPDYNIMASDLALAALIAARQDRPTRAATLSGAAQAMYARQGRKPWEDSSLDALLPGWSSGGQRAAIAAAYAAGQAFTNDEAYTFALNAV